MNFAIPGEKILALRSNEKPLSFHQYVKKHDGKAADLKTEESNPYILAFSKGQTHRYSTKGHPKAKELNVSFEYPSHWQGSEANSPNIVQQFISESPDGQFLIQCMILIKDLPSSIKHFSFEDIPDIWLTPAHLKEIIPEEATYIKSDPTEYDGRSGVSVIWEMESKHAGLSMKTYVLAHMFVYSEKFVYLTCGISGLSEQNPHIQKIFFEHLPLFHLIGNSIVLPDKWSGNGKTTSSVDSIMENIWGEYWLLSLIISAILTWGIGLAPPLIIRFAIARRPLSKGLSITLVVLFWFINIMLFTALGSESKTHAALYLIVLASYAILHKGASEWDAKKQHECSKLRINCPQCGRSLKGATKDMIGDIGVCPKCKAEFTIEGINSVTKISPVINKRM